MKREIFEKIQWVRQFSGEWSFLSCDYFGLQFVKGFQSAFDILVSDVLFVTKKGFVTAYVNKDEYTRAGIELAQRVQQENGFAKNLAEQLIQKGDALYALHKMMRVKEIDESAFRTFMDLQFLYTPIHEAVKIVVNFLPPDILSTVLPDLEHARLHSEKVYDETEEIMNMFAVHISEKHGIDPCYILCLTKEELESYFDMGVLVAKDILAERYSGSAILYKNEEREVTSGDAFIDLVRMLEGDALKTFVTGQCAYPGKVQGRAHIIEDPSVPNNFKKGDILITGMTRPEFLYLFKLSAAVVTDGGGVLAHAAITARELCIPTIVGTEKATTIFKNGDMVEVDAEEGVVRKL